MTQGKHNDSMHATDSVQHIIRVDSCEFMADADSEPRIRDLDLAERLGYEHPRNIRKMVRRYLESGDIGNSDACSTVERRKNGAVLCDVTEFWLSEAAALFIVTRSETPNAIALTKEMIRVFMLARRGLLPQQQPAVDPHALMQLVDAVAQIAKVQSAIVTRLDAMERRMDGVEQRLAAASTDPGGTIGPYVAKQLVGRRITALARSKASRDASRTYRGHRASIENELRARLNWFGLGSQWRFLPTHRRGDMERELDRLEQIERGVSEGLAIRAMRDAAAKQTALPWGAN